MDNETEESRALSMDYYKLGAAGLAVAYAIYAAFSEAVGNSLFSIIIATLLFLSEARLAPNRIAEAARRVFYMSDRLARALIIALAIGGSALLIDIVYGLDFLQDWLDVWVKRFAPALILISITLYFASLTSKRIYQLSEIKRDVLVRQYEISYYLLAIAFMIAVAVLFLGLPVEKIVPTSRKHASVSLNWDVKHIKGFAVLIAVIAVWKTSVFFCILSRYLQWSWMIRLEGDGARGRS